MPFNKMVLCDTCRISLRYSMRLRVGVFFFAKNINKHDAKRKYELFRRSKKIPFRP